MCRQSTDKKSLRAPAELAHFRGGRHNQGVRKTETSRDALGESQDATFGSRVLRLRRGPKDPKRTFYDHRSAAERRFLFRHPRRSVRAATAYLITDGLELQRRNGGRRAARLGTAAVR